MTWYQRCAPCGKDVPQGQMAEHLRTCKKAQETHATFVMRGDWAECRHEVRTPFHGKPNEPIEFKPQESPKC